MTAVMVMGQADSRPTLGTNTVSLGEACRHRHGRPALRQPSFNWITTDKYGELLCFYMVVMNLIQTWTYKLTKENSL